MREVVAPIVCVANIATVCWLSRAVHEATHARVARVGIGIGNRGPSAIVVAHACNGSVCVIARHLRVDLINRLQKDLKVVYPTFEGSCYRATVTLVVG